MADGSEDSYIYMKSRSNPFKGVDNERTAPGKAPSLSVPKKLSADAKNFSTLSTCPQYHQKAVQHSSPFNIPQPVATPASGPSYFADCTAFDLYEQDPDMSFECEDYNLPRQFSDLRPNFEDMIVLPIRLKKPPTSAIGTPSATIIDEFDYADQHVYYSRLITTVNSNSAIHEYNARKGPLWDSAWEMLVPKGLHPAYLTEDEFVKLALSQGNDTTKWMDFNIPALHRRALHKAAVARQKLSNAGISPFELTQEYLESFEWMDKIEQDNFVRTMQKLQLQVAFQKQGLSMRLEDIDNITPVDEEKLIGKSHTKLVDGNCIPRDNSTEASNSSITDSDSYREIESQSQDSVTSSNVPILQTHQSSKTPNQLDKLLGECIQRAYSPAHPSGSGLSEKHAEHVESHEIHDNSDGVHQNNKHVYNIENGSIKLSQFPPSEPSTPAKACLCCPPHTPSYILPPLPPKTSDHHVNFSLQDPPPLSPSRTIRTQEDDGYDSDSPASCSSDKASKSGRRGRSRTTKSSGSQSTKSGKTVESGKTGGGGKSGASGKVDSFGKKLTDSPNSIKKKLSSVFGTIGRSGGKFKGQTSSREGV